MSSSKIHETFKRMFSHAGVIGCCVIDREASRVVHARGSKSIDENNFVAAVSSLLTKVNNFNETALFYAPRKEKDNNNNNNNNNNNTQRIVEEVKRIEEVDGGADDDDDENENDDDEDEGHRRRTCAPPKCIRVRFDRNELVIAPGDDFALVVVQECTKRC